MSQGAAQSGARGDNLIEVRKVSMRFRYQQVLRDIDLTIHRGETVCIIDESGCGKTVMLKLLIGLLHPTQGSVWFDNRDVAGLNGKDLVKMRLRFGFLFQMAALFDSLTVFDNVAFGLREHHFCDEAHVRQIVAERLHEVGLPPEVESKKPAELSGGQRKRVGLARALVARPKLLLLDEPASGLAEDELAELGVLLRELAAETSLVIVEHHMDLMMSVCDSLVVLDFGRVISRGPPKEIQADPAVATAYLGTSGPGGE